MSTHTLRGDEVLEAVLEDERVAALEDLRNRDEIAIDATELADV
jgi:hypothetical protein